MTKRVLYILFTLLGLIPATLLLFIIIVFGLNGLSYKLDIVDFLIVVLFLCGICGYVGLLSLLRGLRKKYHKIHLILLGLGSIVFGYSSWGLLDHSPKFTVDIAETIVLLVLTLPTVVSITFIVLILQRMSKRKN